MVSQLSDVANGRLVLNCLIIITLGFYLTPGSMNWDTGKSTCEGMGMQLASLTSSAINDVAITYINVQQSATG